MKQILKSYLEDKKSKDWMDRKLKPMKQSGFIREAVAEKIQKIKNNG